MKILPPQISGEVIPPGNSRVGIPENLPGLKIRDFPRTEKYGSRQFWVNFLILRGRTRKSLLVTSREIPRCGKYVIFLAQKSMVLDSFCGKRPLVQQVHPKLERYNRDLLVIGRRFLLPQKVQFPHRVVKGCFRTVSPPPVCSAL